MKEKKSPMTFMLRATHEEEIYKIMENGFQPGKNMTPREQMHVHMTCVDDVILDDEPSDEAPSDEALQHVPSGQDGMVILGLTKGNDYNIKITAERTACNETSLQPTTQKVTSSRITFGS